MNTSLRHDYENPRPDDLQPGMMLRIGRRGTDSSTWKAAILMVVDILASQAKVLVWPGVEYEYEELIDVSQIRQAWSVHGIDFLALCKRGSGAYIFTPDELVIYH